MKVYFDNAATTALDHEVVFAMNEAMRIFGNPSSIHSYGRTAKARVETVRRDIAQLFNVSPGEIYFTSGATESVNLAIRGAVEARLAKTIITSPIEHNAVLKTLDALEDSYSVTTKMVGLMPDGMIDLRHLKALITESDKPMVCLMHGNNEIGNILSIARVAKLCKKYEALFLTDTAQTIGQYKIDLSTVLADFITCSAHKIHGPKGVGFLFIRKGVNIIPEITGGDQERGIRSGTENLPGIAGLGRALQVAYDELEAQHEWILDIKKYMIERLTTEFEGVEFNGVSDDIDRSLYKILNVSFPDFKGSDMLLFNLDLEGIAVSGGSACSSGADKGSHVLEALNVERPSIRFSFSKFNTISEVDYTIDRLKSIIDNG